MNSYQVAYLLALAALTYPAWGKQRYALGCLWGNLVVTLAACLAMDLGLFSRDDATVSMLIVDLSTGVALALRPGISQIIAWGYAITVPIYFANLVWGNPIDATYALIYIAATAQVGVLAIGVIPGSGAGGGRRRRPFANHISVVYETGNGAPSGALVSRVSSGGRVAK